MDEGKGEDGRDDLDDSIDGAGIGVPPTGKETIEHWTLIREEGGVEAERMEVEVVVRPDGKRCVKCAANGNNPTNGLIPCCPVQN